MLLLVESEAIGTRRANFLDNVVFKPKKDKTITVHNNTTNQDVTERSYVLDNAFFWTMPPDDLVSAQRYWEHIKENVVSNNIKLDSFWSISDNKNFHV